MQIWQDPHSSMLTQKLLWFSASLCGATSGVFFWVDDEFQVVAPEGHQLHAGLLEHYDVEFERHDRVSVRELQRNGSRVSMLRSDWEAIPLEPTEQYLDYLSRFDIADEIDLVFEVARRPVACLTLFRDSTRENFRPDMLDLEGFRQHLETTVHGHWRVRAIKMHHILTNRYGIKPRELDVLELLTVGASNLDVSEALRISVPTVKTHVINILNKLGLDNRTAIAAFANQLQHHILTDAG